ncbi:MAG TPA: P-loop NTPase [Candidatus Polarisedimenticolia bacterium]|nr:P-loop NTPase [Candidatus Polarisedimenticolia bacterium]
MPDTTVRMPGEREILDALRVVKDPDLHRDIVSLGFVKNLKISDGSVSFDIELTTPACPVKETLRKEAHSAVEALPGITSVAVNMTAQVRRAAVQATEGGMRLVRNPIAIASGKGGVGKSTVATNLALALARTGARVGLMDADVYGPSVPTMLGGSADKPRPSQQEGWIQPVERHGIRYMSMGLLAGKDTPVIWRGPMATKLIQQFLGQVDWGELDYLLIDLPPGTGDVQLTLTQSAPLTGAVIVTTPQDVAVGVTMRGLRMFEQVRVPILGIVENMSRFICSHCGEATEIFKHGGGKRAAEELGVPFLGEIPLDAAIAAAGDAGRPVVADETLAAQAPSARAFMEVAGRLAQEISIVNEKTLSVKHRPLELRVAEDAVELRWSDNHASRYPFRALRQACPCAACVDEWTGEPRMNPDQVPRDVKVLDIRHVGRYAFQFSFSDGHATGIYSYDKLRALDVSAPA